jgi:formate-dependent nitrite reductase membrane component NrfD
MELFTTPPILRTVLGWVTLPLAIGAAVYTAFLFAQAEGRDLWQSPMLPLHLIVQALAMGAGAFVLMAPVVTMAPELVEVARITFATTLVLDLFIIIAGEFGIPHASEVAARAAHEISHGKYAKNLWLHAVLVGHIVPLALLIPGIGALGSLAYVLSVAGLYAYEHAFVMAPQEVPNS